MASSPKAPPPRTYSGEMTGAMRAQAGILPEMLELESYWLPKLQEHQLLGLQGQYNNINKLIQGNMQSMGENAMLYNKTMAPVFGDIARSSRESYMQGLGGGAETLNMLTEQANKALGQGRELDPQELAYATQLARAGAASRGLGMSGQGIAAEVLNTNALRTQRETANRAFATQVLGLNQGIANSAYQLYGQPMMTNASAMNPLQLMGLAQQQIGMLGPQYLNPESQMNADINQANYEMKWAEAQAKANAKNAMTGAIIGGLATMGGAYLGGPAMAKAGAGAAAGGGGKGFSFNVGYNS